MHSGKVNVCLLVSKSKALRTVHYLVSEMRGRWAYIQEENELNYF